MGKRDTRREKETQSYNERETRNEKETDRDSKSGGKRDIWERKRHGEKERK